MVAGVVGTGAGMVSMKSPFKGTSRENVRELLRRGRARMELRKLLLAGLEAPLVAIHQKSYWANKRKKLVSRRGDFPTVMNRQHVT